MQHNYTVKEIGNVTEETMREITLSIDPRCFPDEEADLERNLELYRINPLSVCALYADRVLAGYLQIFPLKESAIEEMKRGVFDHTNLLPCHITPYERGHSYTLYINALAVLPAYMSAAAYKHLISITARFILNMEMEGIITHELLACFSSDKLIKTLLKRRFKKIAEDINGSPICRMPGEDVLYFL